MNKFVETLKKRMKDETAAFIILGFIVIAFSISIGFYEYQKYIKISETNSNINMQETNKIDYCNNVNVNEYSTLTNIVSQEDLKEINEKDKKNQDKENKKEEQTYSSKYYIKVNYGAQVVNIYTKDSKGKYTVPVKAMVCSTGIDTPTSGVYSIGYRWEWLEMIGSVYGHYVTQINGNILFHSVPYLEKGNHASLEWWAYDKLGTKASLGCVRLTTKDALWIFNNVSSGTKVEFYSSSNPGPLGKPSARKISNAPNYVKGWDPTDPDKRNPWPNYIKELNDKDNENNKQDEEDNKKPTKPDKEDNKNPNVPEDDKNNTINDIVNDLMNDISDVNEIESKENNIDVNNVNKIMTNI